MFVCIHISSWIILLRSLHVSLLWLWISLLIKYGSKTIKQSTTKINSSGTFVLSLLTSSTVVIIVANWVALVKRKTDFDQSIWPADNHRNHCIYDSELPQTRVLKEFLVQGWQQPFWKFSILSNNLNLEWCLPNWWKIHSPTVCYVYLPGWQRWQA